jgi:hypothetical protein
MTLTQTIRELVKQRANFCCEYCLIPPQERLAPFHVDHILSLKYGGTDDLNNLCFSCYKCNGYKGSNVAAIDPQTDLPTRLYNPRTQNWDDHFQYFEDGYIEGITAEGRTTVMALVMNDKKRVEQRQILIAITLYPCGGFIP